MSMWDELGTPPDIIALADQAEAYTQDKLNRHIEEYQKVVAEGTTLPTSILAASFAEMVRQEDGDEALHMLTLLYALALKRLSAM